MSSEVIKRLQAGRKELLDIGLRNGMLNFRRTNKSLFVVNSLSEAVFNTLCREERVMTFSARQNKEPVEILREGGGCDVEIVSDNDADLLLELESQWSTGDASGEFALYKNEFDKVNRQRALRLETALDEERLFLQLLKIHTEAKAFTDEQGINTLFLALGFLHWYESDSSEKLRRAPLLLLPVTLERGGVKDGRPQKLSATPDHFGKVLPHVLSRTQRHRARHDPDRPVQWLQPAQACPADEPQPLDGQP